MIEIYQNGVSWPMEVLDFPSGEVHVRLAPAPVSEGATEVLICFHGATPREVLILLLATDAVRRMTPTNTPVTLHMPFVPYARQDRVVLPGEPLSAAVFCKLINAQGYSTVWIDDPHSDVTPALLERVRITPASSHISELLLSDEFLQHCLLVAPDAGARKRVEVVHRDCGLKGPVVYASKTRDPATGKLSGFSVEGAIPPGRPLLVVDDICDGGGTFIGLIQELRKHTDSPIYLFVTHGLFTKGRQVLLNAGYADVFYAFDYSRV